MTNSFQSRFHPKVTYISNLVYLRHFIKSKKKKKNVTPIIKTYILYYFTFLADFIAYSPISPMCNLPTVPECMRNIDPGDTCTGWSCCKQNQRLKCGKPVEEVKEGACIIGRQGDTDCYTVNCSCEVDSVDRSTTTIFSTQGVDSVDRSTTTSEIRKQNQPHEQR